MPTLPSKTYVADLDVPDVWFGGTVRSTVARGVLRGIDVDRSFDTTRVAIAGPKDIPGDNVVALIADDQPLLCARDVEHHGEPLLLVAAPDRATLAAALAAIHARLEPGAPLLDAEQARCAFHELTIERGSIDSVFAQAPCVIEGTYKTGSQEQLYVEPQGCVAWPPAADGTIVVQGSLQCPHYVQKALMRAFALPAQKCRVIQADTGGGFGGKEDYPSVVACHAALLARKCGHPVELIYDRHEDLAVTPKRHPSRVVHRTAVDEEGRLLAMDIEVLLDGGAYTTLSPVVLSRACIHAAGPYRCDHVRIRGRVVKTNHVPYGAFRGFGAPQTCFAVERQMDKIARELQIHPATLRMRNLLRAGDKTATGQELRVSVGSEPVLADVLERSGFGEHPWCEPRAGAKPRTRRGLGLSFFFHGAGFTGSGERMLESSVELSLAPDGKVLVKSGSTEIGQGTQALFTAIAARTLGTPGEQIVVVRPDTAMVPNSGPTVASRTCMIVGALVEQACRELLARVAPRANEDFAQAARLWLQRGGDARVVRKDSPPAGLSWDDARYRGDAYPVYAWGADVAEVEVDLDTFEVEVKRVWTTVDVGKAISPLHVRGQIEGGTLQAVGWSHLEVVTTKEGRFQQDRLATCIVPTALDAPRFEVAIVEVPYPHGPFGAKGIGELPMDGGAPAVLSAIEDATGLCLAEVPATPEKLLAAWLAGHPEEALRP